MSDGRDSSRSEKIDALAVVAYRHAIETSQWDREWLSKVTNASREELDQVHQVLVELHVLEPTNDHTGRWRAVSPRVAIGSLVTPIDIEIRRRAAHADSLRERLNTLLPVFEANQLRDSLDVVQVVHNVAELAMLVDDEVAKCSTQLMTMNLRADRDDGPRRRYLDAHEQGVHVRSIFQHAARFDQTTEALVTHSPTGIEFRTVSELPARLLICGRSTCILILRDDKDADTPQETATRTNTSGESQGVAVAVRHPLLVSILTEVFEEVWARSSIYQPGNPQLTSIGDDIRRSVLRLLATGAKDEVVARRLGISVRTCRRHISDLMNALGATSRFQVGVEAQRRGLI